MTEPHTNWWTGTSANPYVIFDLGDGRYSHVAAKTITDGKTVSDPVDDASAWPIRVCWTVKLEEKITDFDVSCGWHNFCVEIHEGIDVCVTFLISKEDPTVMQTLKRALEHIERVRLNAMSTE